MIVTSGEGWMIETWGQMDIVTFSQEQFPELEEGWVDEARGETCFDTREIPSKFLWRRKRPNKHLYSEISTPFVSSFVINLSEPDSICRNILARQKFLLKLSRCFDLAITELFPLTCYCQCAIKPSSDLAHKLPNFSLHPWCEPNFAKPASVAATGAGDAWVGLDFAASVDQWEGWI